jgi:hypothetical protein
MRVYGWDVGSGDTTWFVEGRKLPNGTLVIEKALYGEEAEEAIAAEIERERRIENIEATTTDQHNSTAEWADD